MTKDEVIEAVCKLATRVGKEHYRSSCAHDCFCSAPQSHNGEMGWQAFEFSPAILIFLEQAVTDALVKYGHAGTGPTTSCPVCYKPYTYDGPECSCSELVGESAQEPPDSFYEYAKDYCGFPGCTDCRIRRSTKD